jgi:hypothetical protein
MVGRYDECVWPTSFVNNSGVPKQGCAGCHTTKVAKRMQRYRHAPVAIEGAAGFVAIRHLAVELGEHGLCRCIELGVPIESATLVTEREYG